MNVWTEKTCRLRNADGKSFALIIVFQIFLLSINPVESHHILLNNQENSQTSSAVTVHLSR